MVLAWRACREKGTSGYQRFLHTLPAYAVPAGGSRTDAQRTSAAGFACRVAWSSTPLTNGVTAVEGGVWNGGSARPVSMLRARSAPSRWAAAAVPAARALAARIT